MAGLFFCPASAEGARLLFCPTAIQPRTSLYSGLYSVHAVYHPRHKTAHRALHGLFLRFSTLNRHDTRPKQTAIIPPAQRWSAYTRPDALHQYQIPEPRRTLYRTAQPPIIIRYIKAQHTADHASPAGQSSGRDRAGGAEPPAALAISLFGLSPDSQ